MSHSVTPWIFALSILAGSVVDLAAWDGLPDVAVLVVHAPADAKLFINGEDMKERRRIEFPGLRAGASFEYEIRILFADGRQFKRKVTLSRGTKELLSYTAMLVDPQRPLSDAQVEALVQYSSRLKDDIRALLDAKDFEGVWKKAPNLITVQRHLLASAEMFGEKSPEREPALRQFREDLDFLLDRLAHKLIGENDYSKAKTALEEMVSLRRSLYGDESKEAAESLSLLKDLQSAGPRSDASPPAAKAAPTTNDARLDEAARLEGQVASLYRQGNVREALPLAKRVLEIRKEVLGAKHADTAASLNNVGLLLKELKDYAEARPYLEQALAIHKDVFGEKHADTATSLNNMGILLEAIGDYAAARPYFEQALAVRKEVLGEKQPQTAESYNNLGMLLHEMGEDVAARPCYEQALSIRKEVLGEKNRDTATSYDRLGGLLSDMGDYETARPYLERSLLIEKEISGEKSRETATSLNNLGLLLQTMGDYAAARPYFEEALSISKEALGDKSTQTAGILSNLGLLLQATGDYAAARPYFEQALAIYRESLGDDHPDTAVGFNNLGGLLYSMKDYSGALSYFEQALKVEKKVLGAKSRDTAIGLNNVGALLSEMGEDAAALPYLEEALAVRKEVLGQRHPETAQSLGNIGLLLKERGDFAAARRYFEQSVDIVKEVLGEKHPETAKKLNNLSQLLACEKDWAGAATAANEARRVVRRHVARVLPGLSEREQLRFLETTDRAPLYAALSLALARGDNPEISRLSATWLINGKAIAQEAIAQRTLLARQATDPTTVALVQMLGVVRQQMAHLATAVPDPQKRDAYRGQLSALEQQEAEIVRRLGQAGIDARLPDPWIELKDVQRNLPADGVLINIARLRPIKFIAADGFQPARYVAWVIPPGENAVQVVDLGDAATIDKSVEEFQTAIGDEQVGQSLQALGEAKAEEMLREKLSAIAEKVLRPLEPVIGDRPRWIISADGALWLVPWAALPTRDGRYALESHLISYLISGRELAQSATPHPTGPALVLANPDYGADSGVRGDDPAQVGARGSSRELASLSWDALPGTAREAEMILPELARYLGQTPVVITQNEATEGKVKDAKNPRLAVLMTHGFYLPSQPIELSSLEQAMASLFRTSDRAPGPATENPLLRCGLVFAGANRHQQADSSSDDGLLLGLEIVGADFRGTELVVLSACETGLGEVQSGEGVAGLRQAFQLSGAEGVLATLWQIPDVQTAQLMSDFWERLADKKPPAEALRDAQLTVIHDRRERGGAAHPIFWAAFTYTGRTQATAPLVVAMAESPRVEVIATSSKLYDGSIVITEAVKGQTFPFDPTRDDQHYYLVTILQDGQQRQAWLLKTDARVVDAAVVKTEKAAKEPLVSDEMAIDLDRAVASLAGEIAAFLKDRGESEMSIGAFLCATPQLQATGGPGIALKLADALQSQSITVKRRAAYGVKGEFRYEGAMRGIKRTGPRVAVQLDAQVVDRSGAIALSLKRRIADVASVGSLLGASADLSTSQSPAEREEALAKAVAGPTVAVTNSQIRSQPNSTYAVEILAKGAEGYRPLPARMDDGMAFVAIPQDALYAVRVTNRSDHDAAVTLTIDGLNMFAFSEKKEYSYFILGKGQSAEIIGWHRSNEGSDAFQITDYGKSAAAELLANPTGVGTITVAFAAAWPEGTSAPADEPVSELVSRGRATGRGPEVSAKYAETLRHVGVIRDLVSVRYDK